MKNISSVSTKTTFTSSPKINRENKQNSPSFTGLNSHLSKKIFTSPDSIKAMLGIYANSNGRVGNLPPEMIKKLRSQNTDSETIKQATEGFFNALGSASDTLREIEKEACKAIDNIDAGKYITDLMEISQKSDLEAIKEFFEKIAGDGHKTGDVAKNAQKKASETIGSAAKKIGILPENGSVEVSYIGEGAYGNAFKLSFLGKAGNNIFHGKVLKVYRDVDLQYEALMNLGKRMLQHMKQMPKEEYLEIGRKNSQKLLDTIPPEQREYMPPIELMDEMIEQSYNMIKDMSISNMGNGLKPFAGLSDNTHGVLAEANAGMFINKKLQGRMINTNMIKPHMFDLRKNFGLTELADGELPEITKIIDLKKMGLIHTDVEHNAKNTVAGRIVDYGGIIKN